MENKNILIYSYIDEETHDYLEDVSKKNKMSFSELVGHILRNEKEKSARRPKVVIEKE